MEGRRREGGGWDGWARKVDGWDETRRRRWVGGGGEMVGGRWEGREMGGRGREEEEKAEEEEKVLR